MIYTEKFGRAAYITKCRTHLMRDIGATPSPTNAFYLSQGLTLCTLDGEALLQRERIAEFLRA